MKPWPFPVQVAGMVIFGMAAAALRVGLVAGIVLCAIAALLVNGRP